MQQEAAERLTGWLTWFGAGVLGFYASKLIYSFIYVTATFFLPRTCFDFKRCGEWAVVTGATDGIGKAYTEQLAEKGLNVILISRSASKLAEVASEISGTYSVKTKCIVADFKHGPAIYPEIGRQLTGADIAVLVNNVGAGYIGDFLEIPEKFEKYSSTINLNVLSVTRMTSLVLPSMVAKKKGVIINVSSISGEDGGLPLLTVYSASKSFVSTLSRSLCAEYLPQGIVIQNVTPAAVSTQAMNFIKPSFFVPTASVYVRSALSTVGWENDTFGCFSHWLTSRFNGLILIPIRRVSGSLYLTLLTKILDPKGRAQSH